ncbi:hypothetical protein [Alteromonas antoniana]|uniref:hypothetical protein n=1 Tax=Alteromonas antoniana TaxID=2803813 RepID=UPI001C47AF5B|nr:hypothetical protein [Alteromonas antoniana]
MAAMNALPAPANVMQEVSLMPPFRPLPDLLFRQAVAISTTLNRVIANARFITAHGFRPGVAIRKHNR